MRHSPQYIWQQPDWPAFRYDAEHLLSVLAEARRAQGILLGKAQAIGLAALPAAENEVWVSEAIATSAIEGEKLNLDAVRSSVARRLGMQNPPAGPINRNVEGLLDAMGDASRHWERPLTRERLFGWQAALFPTGYSSIRQVKVGGYRDDAIAVQSGPEGHEKIHYEAPPPEAIENEMTHFLTWFQESRDGMEGLIRAGVAHLWFETLHPFEDGNGRVGRAIVDMALAQDNGQPTRLIGISRQLAQVRDEYYRYLEQAQKGDMDITEWLEWFIRQYHAACTESTAILDRSLQKAGYWNLHSGTPLSEAQRKVINVMLDAGPQGFEGGMSTKKYVSLAKVSPATASRDLGGLLRAGLVVTTGQGKSTRYWLNLAGWGPTTDVNAASV